MQGLCHSAQSSLHNKGPLSRQIEGVVANNLGSARLSLAGEVKHSLGIYSTEELTRRVYVPTARCRSPSAIGAASSTENEGLGNTHTIAVT